MKKGLIVILAGVLAVAMGLGGLSVVNNARNTRSFIADGYILDPSDEETITTNVDAQYYFTQGSNYKQKYGDQIMFKDTSGENASIDTNHFVHYNDGSLGSFTKGVIMDISELDESNYGYYSLTKNTVLVKSGNSYELTSRGESMALSEFVWKISDVDYMLVSPSITLNVGPEDVTFSDYAQITYIESGIVRISHQTGSYQTVAADSELVTEQGSELNLVGKSFMVDGEPIFSLDDMAIDDDSYIDVDENVPDAPTIPTFNVINGKDGASGSNGTDGEDGETGEEGTEGEEGEEGAEGSAGGEGTMGSEGALGQDGVEGDTGVMGFDGKKGTDGLDAISAGGTESDIKPVNLNARPTVSMNPLTGPADTSFDITTNKATFTLKMDDVSESINQGSTKAYLYKRDTMELVGEARSMSSLESGNPYTFDYTNLQADTEYVMVIEGEYQVDPEDQGSVIKSEFYRKVFKTQPAGISLSKEKVTEHSISAKADVTGTVDSYKIIFYYKENGEKVIAEYSHGTTGATDVVDNSNPAAGSAERGQYYPASGIPSNTTYYAKLANVISGGSNVDTSDSEIELKTLKETPFKKGTDAEGQGKVYITQMPTYIEKSDKNHTLTIRVDDIADPDMGIIGYKYELYKYSDINNALDVKTVKPAYTAESEVLTAKSFDIPDADTTEYVGRVVAIFNDNEKTRELGTQLSSIEKLEVANEKISVVFQNINSDSGKLDQIDGDIVITDNSTSHKELLANISQTYPLTLTATGEYDEIINIQFNSVALNANGETTYKIRQSDSTEIAGATATVTAVNGNVTTIHFTIKGLRKDSVYALSLRGPQDTDNDENVAGTEATTYLAGIRTTTADTSPIALVGFPVTMSTAAFSFGINLTSLDETPDAVAAAAYETNVMENMSLELIHIEESGRAVVLGEPANLKDNRVNIQDSDFNNYGILPRSLAAPNPDLGGLVVAPTSANHKPDYPEQFILTPKSFALENNENVLYSGGTFQIRVKSATDYTSHKNEIPFKEGEDVINFTITEKHVQSANPNVEVDVIPITNRMAADSSYKEAGFSDDTLIGIRFAANYPYTDVDVIEYNIYEIDEANTSASTKDIDGYSDSEGTILPGFIYGETSGLYIGERTEDKKKNKTLKLNRVMSVSRHGDDSERGIVPIEIYFNQSQCSDPAIEITNAAGTNIKGTSTVLERGKRYIITYAVRPTTHTGAHPLNCTHIGEAYPYCSYDDARSSGKIPYYRSPVIELTRQMPTVERYPITSDNGSETWKYRFIDPDGAIGTGSVSALLKTASTYEGSKQAAGSVVDIAIPDDNRTFTEVTFSSLNSYYTVDIPYKLLDTTETPSYIKSYPVQHLQNYALNVNDPAKVRLLGKVTSADDLTVAADEKVTVDGIMYESAIVNEGNYRYRLNLRGTELDKIVALSVKFTDTTDATNSITFDPVYIDTINGTTSPIAEQIAKAYLDAAPLARILKDKTAKIEITAYYSEQKSGFNGYESNIDSLTTDLAGENLFAVRMYEPASESGSNLYRKLSDNQWNIADASGKIKGSLFVPGAAKGNGLNITADTNVPSTISLSERYPIDALVSIQDPKFYSKTETELMMDETGIHFGNTYYTVEKLSSTSKLTFAEQTATDKTYLTKAIGDVMPAVELRERPSRGATSAVMQMNLVGGAGTNEDVYITLQQIVGTDTRYLKLRRIMVGTTGEEEPVFEVVKDSDGNPVVTTLLEGYSYSTYSSANVPVYDSGKLGTVKIQGLNTSTKYQVVFFTYDKDDAHTIRYLYSKDGERTNYPYEISTLDKVTLSIADPTITYNKYNDKYYTFGGGVPGSDGVNMGIKYEILNSANTTIVGPTLLQPNGNESYYWYSQDAADNSHFTVNINPHNGVLKPDQTYTIRFVAYDAARGLSNLGEEIGRQTKQFTTISRLQRPSIYVTTSSSGNTIKVEVRTTDFDKSIYAIEGHFDDGTLYPATLFVDLCSADGNSVIDTKEIQLSGLSADRSSVFDNLEFDVTGVSGTDFLVRVRANYDEDNDGVVDRELVTEKTARKSSTASATLGASATNTEVEVSFSSLKNFENVKKIFFTAFNPAGRSFDSWTVDVPDESSFKIHHDWENTTMTTTSGDYTIQIQYLGESDKFLGDDEVIAVIRSTD